MPPPSKEVRRAACSARRVRPHCFYAWINILLFLTRGGAASQKIQAKTSACWGHVGTFFALERLFFALGRLFCICGRSWLVLALFLTSWSALGSILEAPKPYFSMFFRTMAFVLPSKCMNCCRKPQLAFDSAFRSPLLRGGTCAAHPPPPAGSPSVSNRRSQFSKSIPEKHSQDFRPRIHANLPSPYPFSFPPGPHRPPHDRKN